MNWTDVIPVGCRHHPLQRVQQEVLNNLETFEKRVGKYGQAVSRQHARGKEYKRTKETREKQKNEKPQIAGGNSSTRQEVGIQANDPSPAGFTDADGSAEEIEAGRRIIECMSCR